MAVRVARALADMTASVSVDAEIKDTTVKQQFLLASSLIRSRVTKGSAVLVFVSGMSDIVELSAMFEDDPQYTVCPLHSEIPIEEQLGTFAPSQANKIKIVVATNAAESSITLPDVDVIICLGNHKSLCYHSNLHIVKLTKGWISKASAIQRAGRTGRVRPGQVFRLYSKKLHDRFKDHESAEIQRRTLEEVIIMLRSMLETTEDFNGVIPVLEDLLEPPDMGNVRSSLEYLFRIDMIDEPTDQGSLTTVGHLAASLPVDLSLSRLIVYGILLGVGAEAVIMAAGLALGTSIFEVANPLFHNDPDTYHEVVKRVFLGACKLDGGAYSEPIMYVKIFMMCRMISNISTRNEWAYKNGLRRTQLRQLSIVAKNLVSNICLLIVEFERIISFEIVVCRAEINYQFFKIVVYFLILTEFLCQIQLLNCRFCE
jgi:HrpA-like RNA helicase